jgi:hypothetical protein
MHTIDPAMMQFLLGAVAMGSAVVALVFLGYYRRTSDRLFLFFSASFALDAIGRVWMALWQPTDDAGGAVYVLRVLSYVLILLAILDKNSFRQR